MTHTIEIRPRSLFNKTRRLPPSLNDRVHWAMRSKWSREFNEEAFYAAKREKVPRYNCAEIMIVNLAVQPADFDNLASAVKPVIDGLVLANVIPDDDPEHLVELRLRSERVLHKKDERLFVIIDGR